MTAFPRRRVSSGERLSVLVRLSPLILFFLLFVLGGLASAVLQSLGPRGERLTAYKTLVMDGAFLGTLGHTTYVAGAGTAVSLVLGSVGAYVLWRAPPSFRQYLQIYRLPIILPHLVVAFVVMIFWAQSGLISSLLYQIGVIDKMAVFPRFLFAPNGIGMVVAYIFKEAPFVMLLSYGVLSGVPRRLHTTARMLGATEIRIFCQVIFPHLVPILNQTGIILFLYTFGAFEIPYLLGASRPQMLPIYIFSRYFHGSWDDRRVAMAALVVLSAIAIILVTLFVRTTIRKSTSERVV